MSLEIPIISELGFAFLSATVFYGGATRYGSKRIGIFLAGSVLWTAPLENFAVLNGAYTYYNYAGKLLPNYPGYLMWVGLVPFWVVLDWFVFAMSGFLIFHNVVLPRRHALLQAAASGLFAVNIDLMMDPVASSNGLWAWRTNSLDILSVPLFNFIGWIMLIFFYDLIADHSIFNSKPMKIIGSLERIIFRKNQSEESEGNRLGRFVFRGFLLETFLIAFLTMFNDVDAAVT